MERNAGTVAAIAALCVKINAIYKIAAITKDADDNIMIFLLDSPLMILL
jgi:hypothetical protein